MTAYILAAFLEALCTLLLCAGRGKALLAGLIPVSVQQLPTWHKVEHLGSCIHLQPILGVGSAHSNITSLKL